jgi:serine/threonine protein kinase
VLDFGVARARNRAQSTRTGQIKGKLRYLSPEQVHGDATPRSDTFAAGIVAWELLVGERLFARDSDGATLAAVLSAKISRPGEHRPEVPAALDDAVMKSLARNPAARFSSALEMAQAVLAAVRPATPTAVADWVSSLGGAALAQREERARQIDGMAAAGKASGATPPKPRGWAKRVSALVALCAAVGILATIRNANDAPRPSVDDPDVAASVATGAVSPTTAEPTTTNEPPSPSHPHAAPPARHLTAHPASTCNPPFVYDDAGHKHFFPQCL